MRFTFTRSQEQLRSEVEAFIDERRGTFEPRCEGWITGFDRDFSRAMADRGWIGITWPIEHGGQGGSYVDRLIVTEMLLAAGAPMAAHWFADRQMAPAILAHGTEEQKARYLPEIRSGGSTYCIGMSEPDAGSDLAAVTTRADRDGKHWWISGRKIWTSLAERADYVYLLARSEPGSQRHEGLSEFIVPLDAPGIEVLPIDDQTGGAHFNEIVFDEVRVPDDSLIGTEGEGWSQVTGQLAYERAGLERLMSVWPLLVAMREEAHEDEQRLMELGELESRALAVRQLVYRAADVADRGSSPDREAALAKLLGTEIEQDIVAVASRWAERGSRLSADADGVPFQGHLHDAWLIAPSFTIRGGTSEIMREIIAKPLIESN